MKTVHLLSGGLDSTVMLYDLQAKGALLHCLLVDYGQRHQKELDYAKVHCERLSVPFTILVLPTLQGSKLTDSGEGWIVPFRNAILLGLAVNLAASMEFDTVTIACNADDEAMFPDCRWAAIDALNHAIKISGLSVQIQAPYIRQRKWWIARLGSDLKVLMNETWSCYAGAKKPCGKCPACQKRNEALAT